MKIIFKRTTNVLLAFFRITFPVGCRIAALSLKNNFLRKITSILSEKKPNVPNAIYLFYTFSSAIYWEVETRPILIIQGRDKLYKESVIFKYQRNRRFFVFNL